MDNLGIIGVVVCLTMLVAIAWPYLRGRARERELTAELQKAVDGMHGAVEAMGEADAARQLAEADAAKAREERDAAVRRGDAAYTKWQRQFEQIEKTVHQRDGIWKIYRESALGAGNLQDLLLREIQRLGRFMRAKAKEHDFEPLRPSDDLLKACGQFKAVHRDEKAARVACDAAAAELASDFEPPHPEAGQEDGRGTN